MSAVAVSAAALPIDVTREGCGHDSLITTDFQETFQIGHSSGKSDFMSHNELPSHFLNIKEQETLKKALTSSLCLQQLLVIKFKKKKRREKKGNIQ